MKLSNALHTGLIVMSLAGCKEPIKKKEVHRIKKYEKGSLVIGNPVKLNDDLPLLFPVGSSYIPKVFEDPRNIKHTEDIRIQFIDNAAANYYDRGSSKEYIVPTQYDYDITNILFHDLRKDVTYELTSDTIHILSFAIHNELRPRKIFYRVVKRDYNDDDRYDSKDPVVLYMSNKDGTDFTQLSSDDQQFVDYFLYDNNRIMLVKTVIDSNQDSLFSANDETSFIKFNINQPGEQKNIFSDSLKTNLKKQLKPKVILVDSVVNLVQVESGKMNENNP